MGGWPRAGLIWDRYNESCQAHEGPKFWEVVDHLCNRSKLFSQRRRRAMLNKKTSSYIDTLSDHLTTTEVVDMLIECLNHGPASTNQLIGMIGIIPGERMRSILEDMDGILWDHKRLGSSYGTEKRKWVWIIKEECPDEA